VGKRSDFKRNDRDFYPTPYEAVVPLLPHLNERTAFCEPCAGDGVLINHLEQHGHECLAAYDIQPKRQDIIKGDAMDLKLIGKNGLIITNPPWERRSKIEVNGKNKILPDEEQPLFMLINHFKNIAPTWLLIDADFMHNKQSAPYIRYCQKIVSVGRCKWIPDSKDSGKDNCAWYLFGDYETQTTFYGRK